ncbi:MAG: ATP-dependent DNA ligase [Acidimicrobiales bacterium]
MPDGGARAGRMPVEPPVAPMLAKLVRQLPEEEGLRYEPKWDGFRSIVFRDGDRIELGSRNERPLTRYFPELLDALAAELPARCVLDGEIVIAGPNGLDFEALLLRIHPAASRVRALADSTPASFVAFDLLALGDDDLRPRPFAERRARLVEALAGAGDRVHLTPQSDDPAVAREWFSRFEGAGLDGVMAKRPGVPYAEGERVMWKVKHERTADCVVGGYRWHRQGGVGSLLLGLFDGAGLRRVGVCSSFSAARRRQLVDELAAHQLDDPSGHPWHGLDGTGMAASPEAAHSRWNAGKDLSWVALDPVLVCEVAFDHLQGSRFRHATSFRRWRPDRAAASCTFEQFDEVPPVELAEIFGR